MNKTKTTPLGEGEYGAQRERKPYPSLHDAPLHGEINAQPLYQVELIS